jgi:methylase of polypeptide subunit release factors
VVSNPPYLIDDLARAYRHGAGEWGEGLSLRIVEEASKRLSPGGYLILYTGSAIVNARDPFRQRCEAILSEHAVEVRYEEIDPDVFGEELERPRYAAVDRIAAVALIVRSTEAG